MGLSRWLRRRSPATTAQPRRSDRAAREITRLPSESAVEIRRLEDRSVLSVEVVDLQLFNVAENSAAGTVVGQVQATQSGPAVDPLAYAITGGNDDGAFTINASTGQITVADGSHLDFETGPVHALTVSATSTLDATQTDASVVNVQLTDVYAPAAVTLAGGNATLSVVGGHLHVVQGSTVLFDAPSEDVSSLIITGSPLADHLTVDYSGGDPIPDGGLQFDGLGPTTGSGDTLSITGAAFDQVDYRYDNGHDGGIVLAAGGVSHAIEYRGLEPINDFTIAAVKTFQLSAADDGAVLEDLGGGVLRLRSTTGTFESTTFAAPTTRIEILGGDGNDTITVTALGGGFGVSIDGEGGLNNRLIVDQTAPQSAAPLFSFAGFTFDQGLTPDQGFKLPVGVLAGGFGVGITAVPTATAGPVNFPETAAGFNSGLSIGRLLNPGLVSGVHAQRLPLGDNGTTARSGFELSWSGGRTLVNSAGDDLVFYESSDTAGGPDAAMVQVHVVGGGWTKWYYEVKDARANYVGSATAGAFATAIDLTSLGLADGTAIDGIRYVNMTAADRMEGAGFERTPGSGVFVASAGFVIPNDNGATSNVRPDPGATASFAFFGSATLDPDALYVGSLHPLAGPPPFQSGNDLVGVNSTTVTISTDGTPRPTITYAGMAELAIITRDGTDQIDVTLEAGLPASIRIDGGNTNGSDTVTLFGTTGGHQIQLTGGVLGGGVAVVDGATTVNFANVDRLIVDVDAAGGAGDTVTVDGSFRLSGGPEPQLSVLGGAGQNDRLDILTEAPGGTPTAQNYTFAGVTFDQTATPNQFTELGLGTLAGGQGVVVNTRIADSSSLASGFPGAPIAGFDASLSIGHLFGRSTGSTVRFVGMPDGTNVGTALRSGFLLTWSGDRALGNNGVGNDLVIYESGSAGTPEPTMVQVRDAATGIWSQWVYHPATTSQVTTGGTNVGFASVYDLTDFGIGAAGVVDAVRVVNLIAGDRTVDASGIGVVLPGETAPASVNRPAVGALAVGFTNFGAATLDPDPIYVGALHGTAGATASGDVVTINQGRVEVAGWMTIVHTSVDHVSVDTGGGADRVTFVDTGPLAGAPVAGNSPLVSFTLNTGSGDDVVTVTSVAADFRPSLSIDGGDGTDRVTINGALTLGSLVSNGDLTVSAERIDVAAPIDTTAGLTGHVHLTATSQINLSAAADITAAGNVTIDGGAAFSTAADLRSVAGDITVTDATTLTGNVSLTADVGGIFFTGAAATINGPFDLDLSAGTDIGFDGAIGGGTPLVDVTITTAVNVNFFSTLDAATLTQVDGTGTTTLGGAATLATAAGTALDVRTTAVAVIAPVASTGGELHFFTDAIDIAVGGSLSATAGGIVTITGKTAGQLISLGAEVPATLALSTAELNAVTADIVRIGDAGSGNITIDGLVSPANFDTLHLTTGGTVTGVGAVVIAELAVEAVATLDLAGANDVDRLAVLMTGVSQVTFIDGDDLAIDTVDGVVGLVNPGTTVLTFGAGLTQAAGADVLTDQLQLNGVGDATLTNPTNNVRVLAAAVDGRVDYVDVDAVEIGTVATAGVTSFALTVSAVDIFVTAPIDTTGGLAAGEVHLTATNQIDLAAAGDITAGGSVTIDGGAALSTAADIRSLAGDIFVTSATTLAGDVAIRADLGGVFFLGAAATIDGPQNLTLSAGGNIEFDAAIGSGTPLLDVLIETAVNVGFFDSLAARSLTQLDGTGITFFGGPATLATAVGGTALDVRTAAVLINDSVSSTGGELRIFTDQIVITAAGSLDATAAGIVTISGMTAGRTISLGANLPGFLGLSTAELDRITADVLRIGDATSGNIRIPGLVNPLNTDTLHLTSGGAVFGNGSIIVAELAVEAVGTFVMGSLNDVDRLAVLMTGPSLVAFADANDLVIDTVDGVVGLVNRPGITILAFGGNLTQSATGDIVTGQLGLDGLGDATLLNPGNDVRVMAGFVDGVFQYRDANDLEIGTVLGVDGLATIDSGATIITGGNLLFSQALDVGTAEVHLFSAGAIDDAGGGLPKVIAAGLELFSLAGVGVTNPLETDVDRLAAQNGPVGAIRIHDVGGLLSINAVGGTVGVTNLGGGIEITHVGRMQVDAPIAELSGDIKLTTVADGGDDDHLVINAPMFIAGGAGGFDLKGGTDLLVNDTGILNDIEVAGSGILVGTAGRDVNLGANVRIRSATGAIENIPPLLSNVNGPQVAATGQAFVSFDYGRALELNFRAMVDWSDGDIDSFDAASTPPLFNPGTYTAGHVYDGNPNVANPAAPITITVTLLGDPRIRFTGYEQIVISTTVTVPGEGLQTFVRIDTTPKIAFLGFPAAPRSEETAAPSVVLVNNTLVEGGGGSLVEVVGEEDRVVILRAVLPSGKEGDSVRFAESALDDLESIFKKLRDGRYRVYLFEPDTQQLRLVIEVYIRDGKPSAPGADVDGMRDRPDGSSVEPIDDGLRVAAAGAIGSDDSADDRTAEADDESSPVPVGAAAAMSAALPAVDGRWARRVDAALSRFRDRPFGRSRFSRRRKPR